MKYININESIAQIDESRINRKKHANVYLCATESAITLQFAYSEDKLDHFIIKQITSREMELSNEIWLEFLTVSMMIQMRYRVERYIDDVIGIGRRENNEIISNA